MENKLWIARNANGSLFMYEKKPRRCHDLKTWQSGRFCQMPKHLFPDLTWEDEPIEVEMQTDIDKMAWEYAKSITDNKEIRRIIVGVFKARYNA